MNEGLTFGEAIQALKQGKRAARAGWNGKGMRLALTLGGISPLKLGAPDGENYECQPFIFMKTVQGSVVPWLASQTDMLAEDWSLVD